MISIYIHIPFCNNICNYCDFCKMYYNEKLVDNYLDILEEEVKERYNNQLVKTIYIGGGTPSSLNINQLKRLFEIIKIFDKSKLQEFTIEANIDSINEEKLKLFKENNINRISIGIETIDKNILKEINRYNDVNEIKEKLNLVKKYFNNVNVDLMYGFNNETLNMLKKDLDFVINLDVKHISIYSLILEDNTVLSINKYKRLDDDNDRIMYDYIRNYLKDNNFNQYEISNFSKDSYQSIHNSIYWNNEEYLGFGLGAGSYLNKERITNTRSINRYLNKEYIKEIEKININDEMIYEVILGLRKTSGIKLSSFYEKYNVNLLDKFDIMDLVDNKMLIIDNDYLYISNDYLYVSNSILERFIGGSND